MVEGWDRYGRKKRQPNDSRSTTYVLNTLRQDICLEIETILHFRNKPNHGDKNVDYIQDISPQLLGSPANNDTRICQQAKQSNGLKFLMKKCKCRIWMHNNFSYAAHE